MKWWRCQRNVSVQCSLHFEWNILIVIAVDSISQRNFAMIPYTLLTFSRVSGQCIYERVDNSRIRSFKLSSNNTKTILSFRNLNCTRWLSWYLFLLLIYFNQRTNHRNHFRYTSAVILIAVDFCCSPIEKKTDFI